MLSHSRTSAPGRLTAALVGAAAIALVSGVSRLQATDDGTPVAAALDAAVASVTANDLRSALTFLASDALQGRATGHVGNDIAGEYLAAMLGAAEAVPVFGASLLQPLELVSPVLGDQNRLVVSEQVAGADVAARFPAGEHLHPAAMTPGREVTAPLAFAGYGISAPALSYDDYAGIDVTGHIVVVFDRTPTSGQTPDPFGNATDEHGSLMVKAQRARAKGAVALLLVAPSGDRRLRPLDRAFPASPSPRERSFDLASSRLPIPVARVSGHAAATILGLDDRKTSLDDLRDALGKAAKSPGSPVAFLTTKRTVTLSTDVEQRPVASFNVVGMIKGADPVLEKDVIVVGAHLDHDGIDADGRIYNGADDNGSGTVGVLEIAEAMSRLVEQGHRPKRTIVFALWNGEERGLLGSRAFAAATLPGGRKVVANLNMDMIGRDLQIPEGDDRFRGFEPTRPGQHANTVMVMGYSRSPGLAQITREENGSIGLSLLLEGDSHAQNLLRRSDQWPFLQKRIPALFFFSGLHPDYHTPQDDVKEINFTKLEKIVRLVTRVTWRLAAGAEIPAFTDPVPDSSSK